MVTAPQRLTIDVWADIVCPFCYVGEHRLQQAVDASPHRDSIDLRVHTFQLDPHADTTVSDNATMLAAKLGVSPAQARAMESGIADQAHEQGQTYSLDRVMSSTLDMLRLVQYAQEQGAGWAMLRALQEAVFAGRGDAFDHETLLAAAAQVGLDENAAREVLDSDAYAAQVRADHQQALQLGATGVPFTVLGQRYGIPGAVSTEDFAAAIERAWADVAAV